MSHILTKKSLLAFCEPLKGLKIFTWHYRSCKSYRENFRDLFMAKHHADKCRFLSKIPIVCLPFKNFFSEIHLIWTVLKYGLIKNPADFSLHLSQASHINFFYFQCLLCSWSQSQQKLLVLKLRREKKLLLPNFREQSNAILSPETAKKCSASLKVNAKGLAKKEVNKFSVLVNSV